MRKLILNLQYSFKLFAMILKRLPKTNFVFLHAFSLFFYSPKGSRKKSSFFSGPITKAFTPPPSAIGTFLFRLKIAENGF